MKVAVSSTGGDLEAMVDPRFGRAACFAIVNTDDMSYEVIENSNLQAAHGVGIQSAQLMSEHGVEHVLTGQCGPNAFSALQAAGIAVISGCRGTVQAAVDHFLAGECGPSEGPTGPGHQAAAGAAPAAGPGQNQGTPGVGRGQGGPGRGMGRGGGGAGQGRGAGRGGRGGGGGAGRGQS